MGKSNRLRLRDLRDAYRLIGECRDLGDDVRVWREHMLRGLCHRSGPGPRQREVRRGYFSLTRSHTSSMVRPLLSSPA